MLAPDEHRLDGLGKLERHLSNVMVSMSGPPGGSTRCTCRDLEIGYTLQNSYGRSIVMHPNTDEMVIVRVARAKLAPGALSRRR